jgi:hypothetical protein
MPPLTMNVFVITVVIELLGALSTLLIPAVPFENPCEQHFGVVQLLMSLLLMSPTLVPCTGRGAW